MEAILQSRVSALIAMILISAVVALGQSAETGNPFNKYMAPEGGVNPMSGTVALSKSLASISVGEVSVSFDLSYSGNVFKEVNTRNEQSSVGLVGLGWSFGRAKIISDNRGTSFIGDDQYYLVSASGGRFKILKKTPSDSKWWIEGSPYVKVEQILGEAKVPGIDETITYVKAWKIVDTKGVSHIYGDIDESDRTVLTTPIRNATEYDLFWPLNTENKLGYGLVGTAINGTPYLYPTVWNISRETDVSNNSLEYFYTQIGEGLSGSFDVKGKWDSGDKEYTKETYLAKVISSKGDTLSFEYENKGEGEFFGEILDFQGSNEQIGTSVKDMFVEKKERKYLSRIDISGKNGKLGSVNLCYSSLIPMTKEGVKKQNHVKRLLSAIRYFNKKGEEIDYENYDYYTDSQKASGTLDGAVEPLGALYRVRGKECGWVEYTYKYESLGQGHKEVLDVDSLFGKGYMDDGSAYLVGRKNKNKVVVFRRLNGKWVKSQDIDVKEVSNVEFGDQGWFLVHNKISGEINEALVYQWDGKQWSNVYKDDIENKDKKFYRLSSKSMNVFAGPDYVLRMKVDGSYTQSNATVEAVWTKWGKNFSLDKFSNVAVKKDGLFISAGKNHILVRGDGLDLSNSTKVYMYTFDTKGGVVRTYNDNGLDNANAYHLGNNYFVEVGEPSAYFGGDSRFRAWVWTGSDWSREYKHVFDNDGAYTAMDLQASGQDYYTVRHHSKRYMTNFYWNGQKWSIPSGQKHVQLLDQAWFSSAWKWAGFSGADFFVAGQSRLKCKWWGCDVKKFVYLHLYHFVDGEWTYDYIGSMGEKDNEKGVITGHNWFIENKRTKNAKIWNGEKWITENLNYVEKLDKAYSLGDAFAVSTDSKTSIYYKVGDTFSGSYGSYAVHKKTIQEPVVDKSIEYIYTFGINDGEIAYDEALNSPLFKSMKITLPSSKGSIISILCNGEYNGEKNVGLGSSCEETQYGKNNSAGNGKAALLSKKKTYYERYRGSDWPLNVYVDRVQKEVSFNGAVKSTVDYTYSAVNGLITSTKKKTGNKTTEEISKFVVDYLGTNNEFADEITKQNRIDAVAGGYSCIGSCHSGRIITAFSNGWSKVGSLYRATSSWSMTPKKKMTQQDVENGIGSIVNNGSMTSLENWTRNSFNTSYLGEDVIETAEGPENIKIASFKNPDTHRLYGTIANCGVKEGLMLSGETCDKINDVTWSGCTMVSTNDNVKGYAIDGNRGGEYGRFSAKFLKVLNNVPLSAKIEKLVNKKYRISAWVQTFDTSPVKITVSLGNKNQSINVKTDEEWKKVDFLVDAQSSQTNVDFSLKVEAPSGIHLQDLRVHPMDAVSEALFWNDVWDKVQTTVDNRGVGLYTDYDYLGREYKTFVEKEDGSVTLVSRTTYNNGNCVVGSKGLNTLASITVNGKNYSAPSEKETYPLDIIETNVSLNTMSENDDIKYSLFKGSLSEINYDNLEWNTLCCGSFNPISFSFDESTNWVLLVDVGPFDEKKESGDYVFQFNLRNSDWRTYGALAGIDYGEKPKFLNSYDSTYIGYIDHNFEKMNRAKFALGKWTPDILINERMASFEVTSTQSIGLNEYFVSYVSEDVNFDESTVNLEYPKIYGKLSTSSFSYRDLNDKSFRADNLKIAMRNSSPLIVYQKETKIAASVLTVDSMLYSNHFDASSNTWNNVGSTPVFDRDTFNMVITGSDTVIKVDHGKIVSYLDGVVCDYNNSNAEIVAGPKGETYVAYIGSVKTFEQNTTVEDNNDLYSGQIAPKFVVVKRLYEASETSLNKSIWAGVSMSSGTPKYEGDILSWDGSLLHAVEDASIIKLASDGTNLYLAVAYQIIPDSISEKDQKLGLYDFTERIGNMALTVFKGSLESNVYVDGVNYSRYLRWTPLEDSSVKSSRKVYSLDEERKRVFYLKNGDDFDLEVRNGVPYLMFRNSANENKLSVIKYVDSKWKSIGNPAFVFPKKSLESADLAVSANGNPYVVLKQGLTYGFQSRDNKIVTMYYDSDNALDLTLSSIDLGSDSLNNALSFRQYILTYFVNVGYSDYINVAPKLSTVGDVSYVDFYVKEKFVTRWYSSMGNAVSLPLAEALNSIEVRVVGKDHSTLSYTINAYRKPNSDPDLWGTGLSYYITGTLTKDPIQKVILDVTPSVMTPSSSSVSNSEKGNSSLIDIHFKNGWTIVVKTPLGDSAYTVPFVMPVKPDSLPIIYAVDPNKDTVKVDVIVRKDTTTLFGRSSSSSANSSSSEDELDESDYYGFSSSSSSNSSSSSIKLSENIPEILKNTAYATFVTTGNIRIGNDVVADASLYAGGNVEIGVNTVVKQKITSNSNVFLANRASVQNIHLSGTVHVQDGASYVSKTHNATPSSLIFLKIPFVTGVSDFTIEREQNMTLNPSSYRYFAVREKSTVYFTAGDYYFDSFSVDPNVSLKFAKGVRLWIANHFYVSNFCKVNHEGEADDLFFYIGSKNSVSIGNNVQIRAVIYAPEASVQIFDHTNFEGFVWSANVNIEPYSVLR